MCQVGFNLGTHIFLGAFFVSAISAERSYDSEIPRSQISKRVRFILGLSRVRKDKCRLESDK